MKKLSKILGIVLCLAMVLSLIPAVSAASNWTAVEIAEVSASDMIAIVYTKDGVDYVMLNKANKGPLQVFDASSTTATAEMLWKITTSTATNFTIQPLGQDTKYLSVKNDNNGLQITDTACVWSLNIFKTSNLYMVANDGTQDRVVGVYNTDNFRSYKITPTGDSAPHSNLKDQTVKFYKWNGASPVVTPPYDPTGKTQNEIIDAAYELASGAEMAAPATLTGVISAINTEWSDQYNNITVTIKCAGKEDKPIMCFRLKGDGAKDLKVTDTITVKGTIKNYNGTVEFDAGCTLQSVTPGTGPSVPPYDPTGKTQDEIIDAAYELEVGVSMAAPATLTGVISAIDTAWSDEYNNITVTIKCAGKADKPIQCFRLAGEGAKNLKVGDTVTVKGTIKNYNSTIEFGAGCELLNVVPGNPDQAGDTTAILAVTTIMVLSVAVLAVLVIGKKRMF